jgi:RES domain-containing protein
MAAEITSVDSIVHRYSNYDTPLWARPNSQPGRWHRVGDGPTQYTALTTDGAWAELIRNEELTSESEVSLVRIPMWAIKVTDSLIVDYSTFETAEAAGFNPDALVDDDYDQAQQEGARLRDAGYHGVLAPSAALPGEVNLTLFGPRVIASWGRPPLLASSLSATIIATGSPPAGLLPRARRLGEPHRGLQDHRARRLAGPDGTDGR